jgi:predicted nucleic acid-binding protein
MSQALLIDSDILIEHLRKEQCALDYIQQGIDAIADEAGEYMMKFHKSHALSIGDAVIAATAKEMRMTLLTRNIKHYPMKDIEIVKPY